MKYNWWLEIFRKKIKSEKELLRKMDAIQRDLERHERMVYNWALEQKDAQGGRKYQILIAGHTHIPVFNSLPDPCIYNLLLDDVASGKYLFFNDVFENSGDNQSPALPETLKAELKKRIRLKLAEAGAPAPPDPFYFNTGCGFHSKISCIEISGGKIYLKLLGFDEEGRINFDSFLSQGNLKDYRGKGD